MKIKSFCLPVLNETVDRSKVDTLVFNKSGRVLFTFPMTEYKGESVNAMWMEQTKTWRLHARLGLLCPGCTAVWQSMLGFSGASLTYLLDALGLTPDSPPPAAKRFRIPYLDRTVSFAADLRVVSDTDFSAAIIFSQRKYRGARIFGLALTWTPGQRRPYSLRLLRCDDKRKKPLFLTEQQLSEILCALGLT